MPRIPNPISPLSQAFDNITRVILSMPTAEERDMQASRAMLAKSQAEKAGIDAQLGRKKLGAMEGFNQIAEDAAGPPPAGPMPSGPPINRDYALANAFTRMLANLSERDDLGHAGALWRTIAANAPGASRGYVSNAILGAGGSEASTPRGFDVKTAQDDRQHRASLGNQFAIARMASDRAAETQRAITERNIQAQQAQEDRTLVDVETPSGRRTVTVAEWKRMGAPAENTYGSLAQTDPTTRPPRFDSAANVASIGANRAAETQLAVTERQRQAQEAALNKDFVTVVGADGKPRYMTKSEYLAIDPGVRPQAINLTQPSVTPRNYRTPDGRLGMTVDGLTDRQTGAAIPAGSVAITVGSQDSLEGLTKQQGFNMAEQENSLAGFQNTIGTLRTLASDPTNVGAAGNIRNIMQNALQSADAIAAVFGADPGILRNQLVRLGQETGFRDTIPRLDMMANLAAYQAADALAKQSGRALSNEDVKRFRGMIGNPLGWGANQSEFFARLDQVSQQVDYEIKQAAQLRQRMAPGRTAAPAAAPAAPTAAPVRIRLDAGGNVIQ